MIIPIQLLIDHFFENIDLSTITHSNRMETMFVLVYSLKKEGYLSEDIFENKSIIVEKFKKRFNNHKKTVLYDNILEKELGIAISKITAEKQVPVDFMPANLDEDYLGRLGLENV